MSGPFFLSSPTDGRRMAPALRGIPRGAVGHDDLTDAPNFGTKFGRRRPCPRYGGPLPVHRKKDGFPRRPVGPPRNDKGSGLSLRGAKRRGNPHPPSPKAPLCKGSWHGFAVTEGLSEVAGHFGDALCSDFHPFLATAAQTLRCAPLARVVDETSHTFRRGRCLHRPFAGHHLCCTRRAG